jgi:hypothetical protein
VKVTFAPVSAVDGVQPHPTVADMDLQPMRPARPEGRLHDQELLEKQLWAVSSPPQNGAMIGLMLVAVFLVGIGIGDILSKSKQANTNYASVISRIAEAPQ